MKTFFRIVEKNFKLLFRSKKSLIVILLIPLIITILLGLAFNNLKPYDIKIGIYLKGESNASNEISNVSNEIIGAFQKSCMVLFVDSEEACRKSVTTGELHACIIFKEGAEIESNKQDQIDFYVDYSKANMIWMVLDTLSFPVSAESKEISLTLTQTLLNKLINADKVIVEQVQVLEGIRKNIDEANTKIIASISKLAALDLEANNFGTGELEAAVTALEQQLNNAKTEMLGVKSSVSSLKTKINNLGLDADKAAPVSSALSGVINKTDKLEDTINDLADDRMFDVLAAMDALKKNVLELKNKLTAAKTARDAVLSDLRDVESAFTGASTWLNSSKAALEAVHLDLGSFKITNAEKIVSPISSRVIPVTVEKTHLNNAFPTLLVMVIMFTAILLSSTAVLVEKKGKAFFRNFISPVDDLMFMVARYLTDIITIGVQLLIFIVVSYFLLKVQVGGFPGTILSLIVIATLFILLGMILGECINSQELNTLATIAVSSILLFFSSTILPIESMSPMLSRIAQFNPFVLAESLLRKTIIHNVGITLLAKELALLGIYIVLFFIVVFIITKARRQR